MRRLANVGIINTSEATHAQLVDDTVAQQYRFIKTTAGGVTILGPIPYGKTVRCVKIAAQNEFQQAIMIGGDTVETVVVNTRYKVEIWNPEADYESHSQKPMVYSYTAPAALTGTASTDRTNLYTALANKINANYWNNVTAYSITVVDFTGGTSTGDAHTNFIVGETVTQGTSSYTAQVAKCTITSGTFAADNAAGKIYLYNLSNTAWRTDAVTLTAAGTVAAVTGITRGSTNCVVTQTNATVLHYQGLAIVDDAGYFTSNKYRGGMSRVALTAGFATATAVVIEAGNYAIGVGTDMLLRMPVYDETKQVMISGDKELEFNDGDKPTAGQYYKKYIFEVQDGDVDPLTGVKIFSTRYHVLWFNQATSAHVSSMDSEIDTVIAK